MMRKFALYALILIAGIFAGLLLNGSAVWHLVAGPPDMGRADFTVAERPSNQFVACPDGDAGCPAANIATKLYAEAPERLLERLDAIADAKPRTERVDDGSDPLHRRYVVRTALLKFPDTVSVDAMSVEGGTALRISSRSQIGQSDFGVNGERIREWLAAL